MDKFTVETEGFADVIDITAQVEAAVAKQKINEGLVCVAIASSTTGLTTLEYEDGAIEDLQKTIERLAPSNISYAHDATWSDGNGFAHVRSALVKNSLVLPVTEGKLVRGIWQQIVLIDFDNRSRSREVFVQLVGS